MIIASGNSERARSFFLRTMERAARLGVLAVCVAGGPAQAVDRSGNEVVATVCISCHGSGANGAPKIGDEKAWENRRSQGLTSLTAHALKGIRNMPPHGGNLKLSDLEIGRAVTYMVNRSGGKWVEPSGDQSLAMDRAGSEIVKAQCVKCHEKGLDGAPRIGDRTAWSQRFSRGLGTLVRSATKGHGGMPPRGDNATLSDSELKAAILYMLNADMDVAGAPKK